MRYFIFFLIIGFTRLGLSQEISYHEHIAPILQKNCVSCHQQSEIGAMPLTTYEEVASYGQMIAYVTKTGIMPPFLAEKSSLPIVEEKRLNEEELLLLQQWLEGGLKEGNPDHELSQSPSKTTHLSNPEVTFSMSEAFEQYGIYYDQYRVFAIPTDLEEDRYVSAIEFVPGNKKIVRQVMISIDTSNQVEALDTWDPQYGYFSFGELGFVPMESRWYSWNPAQTFTEFPDGTAKFLPKNAKLLVHIHYGPTGVPENDSSAIRLKFAKKKPKKIIETAPLINLHNLTNDSFYIPANETVRFHAKFSLPYDIKLQGLFPHAHYLCRKWEIFAVEPQSRKAETLLKITDWDFHWKQYFEFQQAKILRKGTIIHAIAEYDNTPKNLANPSDPPRDMAWGKRMYEELFLVFFSFTPFFEKHNVPSFFEILPSPTNISKPHCEVSFVTKKNANFSFEIYNFKDEKVISVFECQSFKEGAYPLKIDLSELEKGNYYFCLKSGEEEVKRLFVYLDDHIFD